MLFFVFFFKQKTAYEMRISDWSSDVCSSDLLALIDLRPYGISGKDADEALERSFITCNKNGVPGDPLPPTKTSGIRVGSPAGTTRGFGVAEFEAIGDMLAAVLEGLRDHGEHGDAAIAAAGPERVSALCARFPLYER